LTKISAIFALYSWLFSIPRIGPAMNTFFFTGITEDQGYSTCGFLKLSPLPVGVDFFVFFSQKLNPCWEVRSCFE